MASNVMTFSCHHKFKILACVILVLLLIQTFRFLPWLQSLKYSDIDHGPHPDGNLTPVAVDVYYETLCPDSKNFILKQMIPVLRKAPRLVKTTFIPYGKAKTHEDKFGDLSFTCQHGPTECFGNKVHSCAVSSVPDQTRLGEYVACMIADNYDPLSIGRSCAVKYDIEWESIHKCAVGKEGSTLLRRNGELTAALNPAVSFIPTVLLDNGHWSQSAILKNLMKEVCSHFKVVPDECKAADQS